MNKRQAKAVIHSLSNPSKMPCKGYSLPAAECKTGSKLRNKKNSVCSDCYACKGQYTFGNVQNALYKRLDAITKPDFVDAMVVMIGNSEFFRWHDSGDIQSADHLRKIVLICERTPNTRHWLPTKEKAIVMREIKKGLSIPDNLTIRYSMPMVDQQPVLFDKINTSHSVRDAAKAIGKLCTAYQRENECGQCRDCWDKSVANIAYLMH